MTRRSVVRVVNCVTTALYAGRAVSFILRCEKSGLVLRYEVKGVKSFDARMVAAMKRHNISHLLTFNEGDFIRYEGITVLTPERVLANA